MARPPRWDAPGAVHHVMVRGIDGREIFLDDADRLDFLERMDRVLPECRVRCFACALLPNHAHLAVQTGEVPLWRAMQRINTGYGRRFNKRHERRGYVFQGRFRSRMIMDDADLVAVVRYVLLNPLRHGLVPSLAVLERHPWSSLSGLLGHRPPRAAEDLAAVLALIDEHPDRARRQLRRWVAAGLRHEDGDPLPTPGIASEHESTGVVFEQSGREEGRQTCPVPTFAAAGFGGPDLADLLAAVCEERGVGTEELLRGSRVRRVCAARAILAYRAVCERGIPVARVAEALGLTPSAVTQAVRRGWERFPEASEDAGSRGWRRPPSPGATSSDS